jgi:hypothetical protein
MARDVNSSSTSSHFRFPPSPTQLTGLTATHQSTTGELANEPDRPDGAERDRHHPID